MAQQHGMIEPFEPGQVRQNAGGGRIISYGTSSYGYDVRCADEFKIFTNINSTIVDPKNFDPRSFVDVQSNECIIPPNSFALARTVEYFRTTGVDDSQHVFSGFDGVILALPSSQARELLHNQSSAKPSSSTRIP